MGKHEEQEFDLPYLVTEDGKAWLEAEHLLVFLRHFRLNRYALDQIEILPHTVDFDEEDEDETE